MSELKKPVTTAQLEQVRKVANEKGIGRKLFQDNLLDNGTMSRVLDAIKEGIPIKFGASIVSPPGGRIYTLSVRVWLDQPWIEAVNVAGPNTPDNFNVWRVGKLYQPVGTGMVKKELVLLNYVDGGSWSKAGAWAAQSHLHRTDPRSVFAISKDYPNFHLHNVGVNPTCVVATKKCSLGGSQQACNIWWYASERRARLGGIHDYNGREVWFAFSK